MINRSPRGAQGKAIASNLHNSPLMVAQHKRMTAIGGTGSPAKTGGIIQRCTNHQYSLKDWDGVYSAGDVERATAEIVLCNTRMTQVLQLIAAQNAILLEVRPNAYPTAQPANELDVAGVEAAYGTNGNWVGYNGGLPAGQWVTAATANTMMGNAQFHTSPNTHIFGDDDHRNDAHNPLRLPMAHLLRNGNNFHLPSMTPNEANVRQQQRNDVAAWQARQNAVPGNLAGLAVRQAQVQERIDYLGTITLGGEMMYWTKRYAF